MLQFMEFGVPSGLCLVLATDWNQNGSVCISDVTALIDYLLNGKWPE